MPPTKPQVTANLRGAESKTLLKSIAANRQQSIRNTAGEIIEQFLDGHRRRMAKGEKLPQS